LQNLDMSISLNGGFLKWWYPTTMDFPTKNDHFGVFRGYHYLRKHPNIEMWHSNLSWWQKPFPVWWGAYVSSFSGWVATRNPFKLGAFHLMKMCRCCFNPKNMLKVDNLHQSTVVNKYELTKPSKKQYHWDWTPDCFFCMFISKKNP